MILRDEFGMPVQKGHRYSTFRGERVLVVDMIPPHRPESTGRIEVQYDDGSKMLYYPSVCGFRWTP